jgi:hypothetical protein
VLTTRPAAGDGAAEAEADRAAGAVCHETCKTKPRMVSGQMTTRPLTP